MKYNSNQNHLRTYTMDPKFMNEESWIVLALRKKIIYILDVGVAKALWKKKKKSESKDQC